MNTQSPVNSINQQQASSLSQGTRGGYDLSSLDHFRGDYFFSGLDASIFFGDVFLGHLIGLEYQLQEHIMPLYKYSDYTPTRIIHGARVVGGSFHLYFQQVYIFYQLLDYLSGIQYNTNTSTAPPPVPSNVDPIAWNNILNEVGFSISPYPSSLQPSTSTVSSLPSLNLLSQAVMTHGGLNTDYASAQSNAQSAQAYYSTKGWASKKGTPITQPQNSLLFNLQSRLTPFYSRYDTLPDGFDINMVIGKEQPNNTISNFKEVLPTNYVDMIAKGVQTFTNNTNTNKIEQAIATSPRWTARKLTGISITSEAQVIDDSGRPLLSTYTFIAKDLI